MDLSDWQPVSVTTTACTQEEDTPPVKDSNRLQCTLSQPAELPWPGPAMLSWRDTGGPPTVVFERRSKGFRLQGKLVPGITDTLRAVFYPDFGMTGILRQARARTSLTNHEGSRIGGGGQTLGKRVDRELDRVVAACILVNSLRRDKRVVGSRCSDRLPAVAFLLNPAEMKRCLLLTAAEAKAVRKTLRPPLHACTKQALSYFRQRRLEPIDSQVAVGSQRLGLATAVDVIAEHTAAGSLQGTRVIVEVKSSFNNYYDCHAGRLAHLPVPVPSSPLHHHQLQLLLTAIMAINTHSRLSPSLARIAGAVVLRVFEKDFRSYPLKTWARDPAAIRDVMRTLLSRPRDAIRALKKKRKKSKRASYKKTRRGSRGRGKGPQGRLVGGKRSTKRKRKRQTRRTSLIGRKTGSQKKRKQ